MEIMIDPLDFDIAIQHLCDGVMEMEWRRCRRPHCLRVGERKFLMIDRLDSDIAICVTV